MVPPRDVTILGLEWALESDFQVFFQKIVIPILVGSGSRKQRNHNIFSPSLPSALSIFALRLHIVLSQVEGHSDLHGFRTLWHKVREPGLGIDMLGLVSDSEQKILRLLSVTKLNTSTPKLGKNIRGLSDKIGLLRRLENRSISRLIFSNPLK